MECMCKEIAVFGDIGCEAKDWKNFLHIREDDKEYEVKINEAPKPSRKELIEMLENMCRSYENLPSQAMTANINYYDFYSLLMLLSTLFKSED